jgi:hypothetical protein
MAVACQYFFWLSDICREEGRIVGFYRGDSQRAFYFREFLTAQAVKIEPVKDHANHYGDFYA